MNVIGAPVLRDSGHAGVSNQNGWPPSFAVGPSGAAGTGVSCSCRRGSSHAPLGPEQSDWSATGSSGTAITRRS